MNQTTGEPANFRSAILFAFALACAAYVAWLVRDVLVLLYVSALFAVVLAPVVRATSQIRIGQWHPFTGPAAILLLVVVVVGALTGFGFLAFPPVIRDLQAFGSATPARVPDLMDKFRRIPFANRLNPNAIFTWLQGDATQAATRVLVSISGLAGKIANIIACFVLTVYFLLEGDHAYRWLLSFVSPRRRQRLDDTLQRAATGMGKWLLGQASLMLILGLASTIVFLALKVRYAYALGVLTGLLNIVPVLGASVSLVLALLVAALDSWGRVIGVAVFFAVYIQIENSWLVPRIMKSRVGLPALAIFIALLLGFSLAGIPGAMVAVPTAVLVAVLADEYLVSEKNESESA